MGMIAGQIVAAASVATVRWGVTARLACVPVQISCRDRRWNEDRRGWRRLTEVRCAGECFPLCPAAGLAPELVGFPAFLARCAGARENRDAHRWLGVVLGGHPSGFAAGTGLPERSRLKLVEDSVYRHAWELNVDPVLDPSSD